MGSHHHQVAALVPDEKMCVLMINAGISFKTKRDIFHPGQVLPPGWWWLLIVKCSHHHWNVTSHFNIVLLLLPSFSFKLNKKLKLDQHQCLLESKITTKNNRGYHAPSQLLEMLFCYFCFLLLPIIFNLVWLHFYWKMEIFCQNSLVSIKRLLNFPPLLLTIGEKLFLCLSQLMVEPNVHVSNSALA